MSSRGNCLVCDKDFAKSTLKKNGGKCGRCSKKTVSKPKEKCLKCEKKYSISTLKKYDGICGKCFKASGKISPKKKLSIPKKIKEISWKKYNGDKLTGKCYSCNCVIQFTDFQAGHIQSEYDGGKINSDNIRPICKQCNISCGVMNLDDFKKSLGNTENKKEEKLYNGLNKQDFEKLVLQKTKASGFIFSNIPPNMNRVANIIANNEKLRNEWINAHNKGGSHVSGMGFLKDGYVHIDGKSEDDFEILRPDSIFESFAKF
jgi:hypothetical protein